MFGAIAGGIASALAGGAMSKLFGGGRSEERFSRNAETDVVCRLLLEKKNALGEDVGVAHGWNIGHRLGRRRRANQERAVNQETDAQDAEGMRRRARPRDIDTSRYVLNVRAYRHVHVISIVRDDEPAAAIPMPILAALSPRSKIYFFF